MFYGFTTRSQFLTQDFHVPATKLHGFDPSMVKWEMMNWEITFICEA
jgi:hypothetical protein